MKIITSLIVALSLALPAFCQQLSQADAQKILSIVKQKNRMPSGLNFYDASDMDALKKIIDLKKDFISENEKNPNDIIAQANTYLEAEKEILRKKPIFIYKWPSERTPAQIELTNQRNYVKISVKAIPLNMVVNYDELVRALGDMISIELNAIYYYKPIPQKTMSIGSFNFDLKQLARNRLLVINIGKNSATKDAFGRSKKTSPVANNQEYYLSPENLRAWYVQVAEMSAKYKAAPALLD